MAEMNVQVVTPNGVRYDHRASYISVATPDGELGILPGHVNLIAPLTIHEMKVRRTNEDSKVDWLAVHGGIIEVKDNQITVVADSAERSRDIDVSRAKRAKLKAEQELAQAQEADDIDQVRRAQVALRRALNRISVSER